MKSIQSDWESLRKRIEGTARGLGYPREIAEDVAGNLLIAFFRRSKMEISKEILKKQIHREAGRLRDQYPTSLDPEAIVGCGRSPWDNNEARGLIELLRESASKICTATQQEYFLPRLMGEKEPDHGVSRQTVHEHIRKAEARALLGTILVGHEARVEELSEYYFTPWLDNYGIHSFRMLREFETIQKSLTPQEVDRWKQALFWLIPKVSSRAFDALDGSASGATASSVLYFLYYCAVRLDTKDFAPLLQETRRQAMDRNLSDRPQVKRHLATISSYMGDQGDQIANLRDPDFLLHEFVEGLTFSQNGAKPAGFSGKDFVEGQSASLLKQARKREQGPSLMLSYVKQRLSDPNYESPGLSLMLLKWAEQALMLMHERRWELSHRRARSLADTLDAEPRLRDIETRASLARVQELIAA